MRGQAPNHRVSVLRGSGEALVMPDSAASPTDLPKDSWGATFKRTLSEFKEDKLNHWAAALTYYAVLSLFPALIVLVSLAGIVASPQTVTTFLTDTYVNENPTAEVICDCFYVDDKDDMARVRARTVVGGMAGAWMLRRSRSRGKAMHADTTGANAKLLHTERCGGASMLRGAICGVRGYSVRALRGPRRSACSCPTASPSCRWT